MGILKDPAAWEMKDNFINQYNKKKFSEKLVKIGLQEGADFKFEKVGIGVWFSLKILNTEHPALVAELKKITLTPTLATSHGLRR